MAETNENSQSTEEPTAQQLLLESLQQIEDEEDDIECLSAGATASELIGKFADRLQSLPRPISSANIPYRKVRDAIFDITQRRSSFSIEEWFSACELYMSLINLVPISYDEAAFKSVTTLMTNVLKQPPTSSIPLDSNRTTSNNYKKNTSLLGSPVKESLKFWKLLRELISFDTFKQNFSDVAQITANGFAQLLLCATTTNERLISTSGLKMLTRVQTDAGAPSRFSCVYKSLVPVALSGLRGALKADFMNLLLALARAEKVDGSRYYRKSYESGNSMSSNTKKHSLSIDEHKIPDDSLSNAESLVEAESDDDMTRRLSSHSSNKGVLEIVGFMQYCCASVPEKANDRKPISEMVVRCMKGVDRDSKLRLIDAFHRLSVHPRSTVRVFVADLTADALLCGDDDESIQERIFHITSQVLCNRTKDKVPAVRSKALSRLADILGSVDHANSLVLLNKLHTSSEYLHSLEHDDKVSVRKSFVHLGGAVVRCALVHLRNLQMITPHTNTGPESDAEFAPTPVIVHQWMNLIQIRLSDAMSTVRTAALSELNQIGEQLFLRNTGQIQDFLVKLWCHGVLPRINDDEPSCQDKCIQSFCTIFLESFKEEGQPKSSVVSKWEDLDQRKQFIDYVLSCAGNETSSLSECLRTLVSRIAKREPIGLSLLRAFESRLLLEEDNCNPPGYASTYNNPEALKDGSWMLFAECLTSRISEASKRALDKNKLYEMAMRECTQASGKVISFFSKDLTAAQQTSSAQSLIEKLFDKNNWTPSFWRKSITAIIYAIAAIDIDVGTRILERCEIELSELGYNDFEKELEFLSFLSIIGDCCTKLRLAAYPPQHLLTFVMAMANTSQKSTPVRASAILTLGKICLVEGTPLIVGSTKGSNGAPNLDKVSSTTLNPGFFENFARTCLPLFVRELQDGSRIPVRNNCILVLSDLCRRYTSIVEPYATRIAARLADRSELIRCQVLGSIGSLLQEDFLKIRSGPVFYRIALALLDDSANVRWLAKFLLTKILHQQSHTLLSTSIIEFVYVINCCTKNKKYNQFPEQHIGNVRKATSRSRKLYPYEVFLSVMSQEQILLLSSRVCSEILTPIVDGKLTTSDPKTKGVLSDALYLLQMVEKKPYTNFESSNPKSASQCVDENGRVSKAALIRKVRIAELRCSLIPLLLELRGILETERSPIIESVQRTLCNILKPYQKNLHEVVNDQIVLSEIQHLFSKLGRQSSVAEEDGNILEQSDDHAEGKTPVMENISQLEVRGDSQKLALRNGNHSSLHDMLIASPKLADFARQCSEE